MNLKSRRESSNVEDGRLRPGLIGKSKTIPHKTPEIPYRPGKTKQWPSDGGYSCVTDDECEREEAWRKRGLQRRKMKRSR